MKAIYSISLLVSLLSYNIKAQAYQKTSLGIKTVINSVTIEIRFYNPSAVRVLKWPEGTNFTREDLSVIKIPQKTTFSIKQQGDELSLKSENL